MRHAMSKSKEGRQYGLPGNRSITPALGLPALGLAMGVLHLAGTIVLDLDLGCRTLSSIFSVRSS